jgi:hypothetical protein
MGVNKMNMALVAVGLSLALSGVAFAQQKTAKERGCSGSRTSGASGQLVILRGTAAAKPHAFNGEKASNY